MGQTPSFLGLLLWEFKLLICSDMILSGLMEQMVTSHSLVPTLPYHRRGQPETFLVQMQRYSDNIDKASNSNEFQVQV